MGSGQSTPKEVKKAIKSNATEFKWERKPYISKFIPSAFWELPLKKLDFNNCGLTEIPPPIFVLLSLQELSLHSNSIQTLPEQISGLKKLRKLNLSSNHLVEFPDFLVIALVGTLLDLNLSYNDFKLTPSLPALKALLGYDYIGIFGNSWSDSRLKAITKDTPQNQVREIIAAIIKEQEDLVKSRESALLESTEQEKQSLKDTEAHSDDPESRSQKARSQFASGEGADGLAKAFAEFKKSRDSFSALRKSVDVDAVAEEPVSPPIEPPSVPEPPQQAATSPHSGSSSPSKQSPAVARALGLESNGSAGDLRAAGSMGSIRGNLVPVLAAFGKEGQSVKLRPVQRKEDAQILKKIAGGDESSSATASLSNLKHKPGGVNTGAIPSVWKNETPAATEPSATTSPTTLASELVETPQVVETPQDVETLPAVETPQVVESTSEKVVDSAPPQIEVAVEGNVDAPESIQPQQDEEQTE